MMNVNEKAPGCRQGPHSESSNNHSPDTASQATEQAGIDFNEVESIYTTPFGLRMLSPSLDRGWSSRQPAHVLPPLPHICLNRHASDLRRDPIYWSDAKSGDFGEGAISLAAHVLHIPLAEAAARLWRHALCAIPGSSQELAAAFRKVA